MQVIEPIMAKDVVYRLMWIQGAIEELIGDDVVKVYAIKHKESL